MTKSLFCSLLMGLWACSSPEPDAPVARETASKQPELSAPPARPTTAKSAVADSVVLIRLANDITLHWSNRSSGVVHDELLRAVKAKFPANQHRFVALILDTTATAAVACPGSVGSHSLVRGDVAFLLVLQFKQLPWYSVYGIQWDSFDYDCPYANGMLRYVAENRTTVWRKTANYLAATAQATRTKNKPAQ